MVCCDFECYLDEQYIVACPTSDRLHEQWCVCHKHITRTIRFLQERDEAWGIVDQTYLVIEIQEEFAF